MIEVRKFTPHSGRTCLKIAPPIVSPNSWPKLAILDRDNAMKEVELDTVAGHFDESI